MKFRIKYAQQVVGFFLLLSLVALVVVLIFMGANQRWFARNYLFFTRFSSADGLSTGLPVKLQGFEIGKISGIELNSFNRVKATIAVYEDYYAKIRPDSVLEIQRSPIGLGTVLNLLPGKNNLPPMEENSFLPSSESTLGQALIAQGLTDKPQETGAIAGIIAQVEPALVDVRNTAQAVTKLLGQVSGAAAGKPSGGELTTILAQIESTLLNVNQVLSTTSTNVNGLITQNQDKVAAAIDNMNQITAHFEQLSSQLQDARGLVPKLLDPQGSLKTLLDDKNVLYGQITQILAQVNDTMKEVKGLTTYLNQSTPQISGLLEDTKSTIKKAGDVMDGLKNNPLLKGGIPETKPQSNAPQGQRDESF